MMTTVVWRLSIVCGRTWTLHTTCVTGSGESFSSCSSTMDSVSSNSLTGSWITRRKTCSTGSRAMFSLGWNNPRQSWATSLAGSGPSTGRVSSWSREKPFFPAPNIHNWRKDAPSSSTLEERQRLIAVRWAGR